MGQFDATKKFLSSQQKSDIPVWTQVITTILHFIWCLTFIRWLNMKEVGAAIATNLTYILNMVIADVWIRFRANTEFEHMIFFYDSSIFDRKATFLFL